MQTFLLALFVMLVVVTIMAVGVLMGRKPIAGSCGGIPAALGKAQEDYKCPVCGDDPNKCDQQGEGVESAKSGDADLFYAAGDEEDLVIDEEKNKD
jgi:hypothetical protein